MGHCRAQVTNIQSTDHYVATFAILLQCNSVIFSHRNGNCRQITAES